MAKKPTTLTDKQKAFALLVAEGSTYSAAYREAYDALSMKKNVIWDEASKLMRNPLVSHRVIELQEKAAERTLVTIEKQTERLKALSTKGEGFDNPSGISAAINAEREINKLNGLIIEKKDHSSSDGTMTPQPLPWAQMYAKDDSDSKSSS